MAGLPEKGQQSMFDSAMVESRRQVEICNACRYCEGYCSVFPAMFAERSFSDGSLLQLANLCHNCRGCYYACQYTPPHQFALNLPSALGELRQESWKQLSWPQGFAYLFDRAGVVMPLLMVVSFTFLFWLVSALPPSNGEGFYTFMSHTLMVIIFLPAFLVPLLAVGIAIRRYWHFIGGGRITMAEMWQASLNAISLRNLKGGHGDGCNFEDEDRFTKTRSVLHKMTFWGFMMCFGSTCSGTILHYGFGLKAPYTWYSLPKLLGVPGGVLLCLGTAGLAWIKTKADRDLGHAKIWGSEMAFILLLFSVSATGLMLYAATGSSLVEWFLPIHLGTVLTFFLLTPYSKMMHGFYRMAALIYDQKRIRIS